VNNTVKKNIAIYADRVEEMNHNHNDANFESYSMMRIGMTAELWTFSNFLNLITFYLFELLTKLS